MAYNSAYTKYIIDPNFSIYCSPDVSVCGKYGYSIDVTVDTGDGKRATYKVALMCRVDPELIIEQIKQVAYSSIPQSSIV